MLEENKNHTKSNKELSNAIRVNKKELDHYNEIKDKISDQSKTLTVLFYKGIINNAGKIIENL